MIAEIKLYTNKKGKAGYPVVFYYRNNNIRKRIALGWYFEIDEWDMTKHLPLSFAPDFEFILPKILNYRQKFKELLFNGETDINQYIAVFEQKKLFM